MWHGSIFPSARFDKIVRGEDDSNIVKRAGGACYAVRRPVYGFIGKPYKQKSGCLGLENEVGVTLIDPETDEVVFDVNFWHWRAIVEAIRSLKILPTERVDGLHEPFFGELSAKEACQVGVALREHLLPSLGENERLLLDGQKTTEPDDLVFHRDPHDQHKNYSTNREVLEKFADCCERCHGFRVA